MLRIFVVLLLGGFLLAGPSEKSFAASASTSRILAADKVCTGCHDEEEKLPILSIYQTRHGVLADARAASCIACHGPSEAHVKNPGKAKERPQTDVIFRGKDRSAPAVQNGACLACHLSGKQAQWAGSGHATRDIVCTSCHVMHTPADPVLARATEPSVCFTCHQRQRAQIQRISAHPVRDGKMACAECHNPHGSTGPKLLVKNSVNETCFMCHAEKRGPFLWEHAPASDNCGNCHTPHGSTNRSLLQRRVPWLCQQCHIEANHPGVAVNGADLPGGSAARRGSTSGAALAAMRGCTNCHSQVHGTNHPSGARLLR